MGTGNQGKNSMTDTKPVYVRAGKATREKFDELVKLYGSQTQVFAVAIDRLYQSEVNRTTVVGPVRRSYAFANWLHGYNAQHSTDYRPTTVPDSVVEQYNANRTATPQPASGVGEREGE